MGILIRQETNADFDIMYEVVKIQKCLLPAGLFT